MGLPAIVTVWRPHTIFPALVVAESSPVPVASAVASSSARCQPATCESRGPRDTSRWLHKALAIVMLSSMCCVSVAQGTWSTAQLSVARTSLAATSVGNVAIFGGGIVSGALLWFEGQLLLFWSRVCVLHV